MYEVNRAPAEEGSVNTEFEAITTEEAQQIVACAHYDFLTVHEFLRPKSA